MADRPLRIAIVGCGGIASAYLLAVQGMQQLQLAV